MAGLNGAVRRDLEFGFLDASIHSDQIYNPILISNHDENTMLKALLRELSRSHSFTWSVAFITEGALAMIKQALLEYSGQGTVITSNYLDFNEPDMFRELQDLENIDVRIHADPSYPFHAKGYVFHQADGVTAIVGSSNLTRNALLVNNEWNLRFSAMPDGDITHQLDETLERQKLNTVPLSKQWIESYEQSRSPKITPAELSAQNDSVLPVGRIAPNAMQREAVDEIQKVWDAQQRRAVVVSATGTGKTILAALAVRHAQPKRLLFLVHREQILDKAITEFQRVLEADPSDFGKFVGTRCEADRRYVFSTVQSFSKPENLAKIDPAAFDFVIIDEVHRAGAQGYQRVLDKLDPEKLLGLTATPERTDGFNIYELFDYNVPYEIRLQRALEEDMLVPFNYYGITDYVDADSQTVETTEDLNKLLAPERVKHIVEKLEVYGHKSGVCGLMFCSKVEEARELSVLLNNQMVNGRLLRTTVLAGNDDIEHRNDIVAQLEQGIFDYVLTVDIFNEGIDIPAVNQVVMLRNTQSSIIFTQQLGRGLRKAKGKDHLRVIDFIGNYKNNFLIPIALFGDSSLNSFTVKEKLIEARNSGAIAGVSSVNFDQISRERILQSLDSVKLDSMANLRKAFNEIEQRLGGVPRRYDFARFDNADPVILSTTINRPKKPKSYWELLLKFTETEIEPTDSQGRTIAFLDNEILNGKRPHELLLIEALIKTRTLSRQSFREVLITNGLSHSDDVLTSVENILTLDFFSNPDRSKYGPVLQVAGDNYQLDKEFASNYSSSEAFAQHVDDVVETGLYLARHRYEWATDLQVGMVYSRKDATRLLNWARTDIPQNIGGYKLDRTTMTCPIFVTYDKEEDISETTKYEDAFVDPTMMHWFTKNRRTLESPAEKKIAAGDAELHLFVKKSDQDAGSYFYLGIVTASDAKNSHIPDAKGNQVNIVEMNLNLETPVSDSLYDMFVAQPIEFDGAETKRPVAASENP